MGLDALLLPSFNIRGKCPDQGLIIVAGLSCSKFIIAGPACICGCVSSAAFWLNVSSSLTTEVALLSHPASLAGVGTHRLGFSLISKAFWGF